MCNVLTAHSAVDNGRVCACGCPCVCLRARVYIGGLLSLRLGPTHADTVAGCRMCGHWPGPNHPLLIVSIQSVQAESRVRTPPPTCIIYNKQVCKFILASIMQSWLRLIGVGMNEKSFELKCVRFRLKPVGHVEPCASFRDFLPRGSGIVTRRPLILQLVNSKAGTWLI